MLEDRVDVARLFEVSLLGACAGALLETCVRGRVQRPKLIYAFGACLCSVIQRPVPVFLSTVLLEFVGGIIWNSSHELWNYDRSPNLCGQIAFPESVVLGCVAALAAPGLGRAVRSKSSAACSGSH